MEETFTQGDLVHKLRQLICAHIVCCRQETPPAEKNAALYKAGYLEHELSKALLSLIPIPVSERLPEVDQRVLGFMLAETEWITGKRVPFKEHGDEWWTPDESGQVFPIRESVTHWLPLPPKPD